MLKLNSIKTKLTNWLDIIDSIEKKIKGVKLAQQVEFYFPAILSSATTNIKIINNNNKSESILYPFNLFIFFLLLLVQFHLLLLLL